jgi:hypothetical protein
VVPTTLACARPLPRRTACGVRGGAAAGGWRRGGWGWVGGVTQQLLQCCMGPCSPLASRRTCDRLTGYLLTLLPSLLSPRWKSRAKASVNQPDLSEGEVSLPPGPPSGQG